MSIAAKKETIQIRKNINLYLKIVILFFFKLFIKRMFDTVRTSTKINKKKAPTISIIF